MGASLVYLNEPNKDIEHEKGANDYLAFATGSMQGWRLNMVSLSVYLWVDSRKNRDLCPYFQTACT